MAILIAHRGFRIGNQENRMIDFENALEFCQAVEFDIRLTKDNQVIIFHDDTFKRIAHERIKVKKVSFQEITDLKFFQKNPTSTPPLLSEFSTKLSKKFQVINVEIKEEPKHKYSDQELEIIFSEINKLKENTNAEIIVSSFDLDILKEIKLRIKSPMKKGFLFDSKKGYDEILAKSFDYIHPSIAMALNKKIIPKLKSSKKPLNIWTFKTNDETKKINEIYQSQVSGYISDNPNLIRIANYQIKKEV